MIKQTFNLIIFSAFFLWLTSVSYAQIDIKSITPTPTQVTTSSAQITEKAPPCITIDQLTNQVKVKNIITGQYKDGEWYSIKQNSVALTAEKLFNKIDKIVKKAGIIQDPDRQFAGATQNAEGVLRRNLDITGELSGPSLTVINEEQCAVRITGSSPTLFIYSTNTKVLPSIPTLYLESNDEFLYYEYDGSKITFERPKEGWIINKKDLKSFAEILSSQLNLTVLEKERLYFELNFSVTDVKSDKLFIGLILQSEIDKQIPLEIKSSNNPIVLRYHFYVSDGSDVLTIKEPKLNEIQRSKSFILEFGSVLEK